jgi:predicted regulator of Ras-like GTPase activity (Roadblock/LC7/MglB family)
MKPTNLDETVAGVTALRGLFITLMPDCLLFDSYVRPGSSFVAEDVASYFGDLVRANREGLKSLRSWSQDMQVTIESADTLVVLKELRGDFVASFVFDRDTPLGMVRLFVRRLLDRLEASLPDTEVTERPRAVRALEFVQRYAPDPHATLMRVALKSGLSMDALQKPESLDDAAADRIEDAAKDILGLEQLAY